MHSKNARLLISELLNDWDRENCRLGRKICSILDNCAAHPTNLRLANIKLIFLSANTTALIQPLDQGIIRATKAHYRRLLLQRMGLRLTMNIRWRWRGQSHCWMSFICSYVRGTTHQLEHHFLLNHCLASAFPKAIND